MLGKEMGLYSQKWRGEEMGMGNAKMKKTGSKEEAALNGDEFGD